MRRSEPKPGETWKERAQRLGLRTVLTYLERDPEHHIPQLIDWVDKFDRHGVVADALEPIREALEDKTGNWYQLVMSAYSDLDVGVRKKLFENLLINATIIGGQRQRMYRDQYQCNIPWAILMDPTSACNLRCRGCWAADYGDKMSMSFDTLDSIIEQGKALGVYMYIFSGGEPLVRKRDIIRLCEKHQDCAFLAFTNGTLIDEEFAEEMLRVKNFAPAISVEGFEEQTDARRGEGTYQAVVQAMSILKDRGLLFGVSCCYTRKNTEVVGSEAFIDAMIEMGAKFAWFFTYMPVGVNAVVDLMVTPEQREYMYHQIRKFRETKPLFTIDFWNDGEYVNGCIAGGRNYLHINANGDIEPCAFIHYSDSSIYEKTLLEALQSPLFMQYRQEHPFNSNHLRPCPLLDNKGKLAELVEKSGARSTDLENPEDVRSLCAKCEQAADAWEPVADRLWCESRSVG
ncbi:MAG: radical SAM protein [Firmicutes bacterium]|nr:radical SAM protein [Bacillota bacterium]